MHQTVTIQQYPDGTGQSVVVTPTPQPANALYSSFCHDVVFVCCGTIGAAYLIFLLVGVPFAMVYIGYKTMDDCPAEPMIPYYLMISGAFSIFRTIWYFLEFWFFRRRIGARLFAYVDNAMCFATACMASLYLFGLYWTLHIAWPNITDDHALNYCDASAYLMAFVTVVGVTILSIFWCLCICVLAFQVVPVAHDEMNHQGVPSTLPVVPLDPVQATSFQQPQQQPVQPQQFQQQPQTEKIVIVYQDTV